MFECPGHDLQRGDIVPLDDVFELPGDGSLDGFLDKLVGDVGSLDRDAASAQLKMKRPTGCNPLARPSPMMACDP